MIAPSHDRGRGLTVRWPARAPGAPSRRSCEAASRFGLLLDEHARCEHRGAVRIDAAPGTVTLFSGPSGAGKSTLLRAAGDALRARGVRVLSLDDVRLRESPAVDLFPGSLDAALRALARVGLGQAGCFLRRPRELSEGQRWRLRLAAAMHRADGDGTPAALLIDECCAGLDPATALGVCAAVRRAATAGGLRVLCASADPRVASMLDADEIVRLEPTGAASVDRRRSENHRPRVIVERASMREYAALASLHYRTRRPARPALVLAARIDGPVEHDHPVGALVVAHPALNSPVREAAWPGEYTGASRAANARKVNAEVRSLARCVVDPRFRGLGVATALVRAYLDEPLTARTEAMSAMGEHAGFLDAAGMTRHALPVREPDARLLDALAHAGVEPWRLAQGLTALRRAVEGSSEAFIERELRSWARWGRAHRQWAKRPLEELFLRACRFAACRQVGHTHARE